MARPPIEQAFFEDAQAEIESMIRGIFEIVAGSDMATAKTALTAVCAMLIIADSSNADERLEQARGLYGAVLEQLAREDVVEFALASLHLQKPN